MITWYKGDRIVSTGSLKIFNEPRFSILTSPDDGSITLAIRKVHMGDEDDYVCEVNLKDAPISIMHHLEVLVPPRIHSVSGNGRITARKGSAISLSCIASGRPPPAIHWERQHHKYFSGGRLTAAGPALDLVDIGREDEGIYVCVADNLIFRPVTDSIALNVLYPPEVRVDTPLVHAAPGDSTQLECIVQGNPEPTVNWYKGMMKLTEGERHLAVRVAGKRYRLTIAPVLRADFGNYSCVSENGLGKVRGPTTRVTLTGAPMRPQVTSSPTGRHPYSYDLKWQSALPYPVLQHRIKYWPIATYFVHHQQRHCVLIVLSSQPGQNSGRNSGLPQDERGGRHRRQVCRLQRRRPFSGGGNDGALAHERALSVLFEYNIKGLQPQTKYMIQVQTRNEAGWSPESEPFAFSTSQVSAAASPSWSWSPMLTTVLSLTPILVSVLR